MRLRGLLAGIALGIGMMNQDSIENIVASAEEATDVREIIRGSFSYKLGGKTPEDYAPRNHLRRELMKLKPGKKDNLVEKQKEMLMWLNNLEEADKEKKTIENYIRITKELPEDEGKRLVEFYKPEEFFSLAKKSVLDTEATKQFLTRERPNNSDDEVAEQTYFKFMDAFAKYEMIEEEVRWSKERNRKPSWEMILIPGGEIEFGNGDKKNIEHLLDFTGWTANEQYANDPSMPRLIETAANKHFISYLAIESEFHEKKRVFNGGSFEIGRHEVRNRDFRKFLEENPEYETPMYSGEFGNNPSMFKFDRAEKSFPEDSDDYPIVNITPDDMKAYAKWLSKKEGKEYSIPNEIQFESVSRSFDGREYVRGNRMPRYPHRGGQSDDADLEKIMDLSLSAYGFEKTGKHAYDTSPLGAMDMMANVAEIVTTENDPRPSLNENERNIAKKNDLRNYYLKAYAQKGVGAGFKDKKGYDVWKYFEVCQLQTRGSAREAIDRDQYFSTLGGRLVRKLE